MFLTKGNNYPLGLDFSDLSLKFVQLKRSRDQIEVQSSNKINLASNVMDKGEIKNDEALLNALGDLLAKPKFGTVSTNEVNACLPDTKTFIKLIEVEKSPNPLPDIIRVEVEKHVPLAIKDVYFDWQVIFEDREKYGVLIGASPKSIVDRYLEILRRAKLTISSLEIESVAVCRALIKQESPKQNDVAPANIGIIDIGAKRSNMIIYAKNAIALSISLPIAGEDATSRISSALEINRDQAEKAKIICGLDKSRAQGIIRDILTDMVNQLVDRINDTAEFFANHYPTYGPLQEILLCGGGSNIKDIETTITDKTGIKTGLADIYTNITEDKKNSFGLFSPNGKNAKAQNEEEKSGPNRNFGLSFTTAIGLALRGIFHHK